MSRWTQEQELELIKKISNGVSFEEIATKMERSESAIELRLKKIIYECVMGGKNFESLSKILNLSDDKLRQYFYSYKDFHEKHGDINSKQPLTQLFDDDKNKTNDSFYLELICCCIVSSSYIETSQCIFIYKTSAFVLKVKFVIIFLFHTCNLEILRL